MPLMLPSESDVGDVGSNNSDMASQWCKDNSVAKGKRLERTSSFYPGCGDNTHVSTRLDRPNYAFLTPEVDDDGSETEECLTEEEHAVELALRHPSKFSESMAIEDWVVLNLVIQLVKVPDCLLTAANRHKPGATDILERLQHNQDYMLKITPVPRARICLIQSEIKERCNTITMGVFLGFDTALDIIEYVQSQLSQYTYTFPRANIDTGPNSKSRKTYQWYDHADMFFTGGSTSFARRFQYLFPTYECREVVVNHEVPVPMVALVATALYATIYEWHTGEQQVTEFSANVYLDVYHGNVNTLTHIRENREDKQILTGLIW
ncbi:hypothetical protein BJY52DRAFT_1231243 [Lactarius psammicola]|nr:hypothetical protein BJY52DRAFT_1231243 [Lactarius psammicola]